MRCAVLAKWRDTRDRQLVRIDIANPNQIESTEVLNEFVVAWDADAFGAAMTSTKRAFRPGSVVHSVPSIPKV